MKQKLVAITILVALACLVIYINSKYHISSGGTYSESDQGVDRPLPDLTSPKKRLESYTPAKGDIKYRVVPRPVVTKDPATGWNIYTSSDYGFSFTYPPNTTIESTESLGYQLPPNLAYKGSRDNFEIKMTTKSGAYFLLFLNYPNFHVDGTTTTAQTLESINGLQMTKQIMQSLQPQYASSQITMYSFEKSNRRYIWYGTFDFRDYESINNFQSIVASTKFFH